MLVELLIAAALGYFFGSLPFGLILTKFAGLGDVREIGSGNIGATNVLRTGNKLVAFLTLLGDVFKGTLPVILIGMMYAAYPHGLVAGFMALIGHMFPVWLSFKGGKGVATYIGVSLGVLPYVAVGFAVCWLVMAFLFRYSSLSALAASIAAPVVAYFAGGADYAILFFLMSLLVIIRHRSNIERLLKGEEDKIGKK